MSAGRLIQRAHVWLGWLVGVPLLFWTASGLWMVARPIEEVRGTALRRPAPTISLPPTVSRPLGTRPIKSLSIEPQASTADRKRPVWIIGYADGGVARANASTGMILAGLDKAEARTIARAAYAGPSTIATVTRSTAEAPPIDLRRPRPAWRVEFGDGTRIYVDADSGAVLALRTRQWRLFDWMWGLHIMDLGGREDTSHAILIVAAALALIGTILGVILLPLRSRRQRSGRRDATVAKVRHKDTD